MLFGWSDGNFMESFMNLEAYNVFEAKKNLLSSLFIRAVYTWSWFV